MIAQTERDNDFVSTLTVNKIDLLQREIKNEFKVDYYQKLEISDFEKKKLAKLINDYLVEKTDNFNTHYIQLLAWYIGALKIIKVKSNYEWKMVSFLEYSPGFLRSFTCETNRIFNLFMPERVNIDKVYPALLITYLNNYDKASERFKNVLKRYLKNIKVSRFANIYFFDSKKVEKFLMQENGNIRDRLLRLGVSQKELATKYFKEVFGV